MQDEEIHAVLIEHWTECAADGGLLTDDKQPFRLIFPSVFTISPHFGPHKRFRIIPAWPPFNLPRLINDPFPRNLSARAGSGQNPRDICRVSCFHAWNQAANKQLIADRTNPGRLNLR